jgi:hypothetical protein
MKRCQRCILPANYPDSSINEQGLCSYCRGEKRFGISSDPEVQARIKQQKSLKRQFEKELAMVQGRGHGYDCLVPVSGGKDSTYLLWLLSHEYGMNCLAFFMDKKILPPLAYKNVQRTVDKLGVDLLVYRPNDAIVNKIYSHGLRYPHADGCVKTTCRACYLILQTALMRTAVEKGIPHIHMGFSPDQIEYHFFEIPQQQISERRWLPEEIPVRDFLAPEELNIYWNPSDYPHVKTFPRFFFPFHVLDYDEERITTVIDEEGLIPKRKSSVFKTNCYLNWMMIQVDLHQNGYNPYIGAFSELIRQGKASRSKWLFLNATVNNLLRMGLFKRKEIRLAEKEIGLTMRDVLNKQ